MKIFVTGGFGFIGKNLVKELLDQEHEVVVLDDLSRGSPISKRDNLEIINGSVLDFNLLSDVLSKKIDIVYHLAAVNGTKNFYSYPDKVLEVGTKGIINLIDASKNKNIKKLYVFSSSEVYQTPEIIPTPENVEMKIPDPFNSRFSYAGSKIISELFAIHLASKFFKEVIIIRPHNIYGPDMGNEHVIPELIYKIKKSQELNKKTLTIEGNGQETRSFMFIDDFISALKLIDSAKNNSIEIFNIGVNDEIKIVDLVKNIFNVLNFELNISYSNKKKGGTIRRCPDISKIKDLGFEQKFSLIEGLRNTIKWYSKF